MEKIKEISKRKQSDQVPQMLTIVPLFSIKYFHIKWHQIEPLQKNDYMEMNLVDQYQRIL